jgi:hypothetical protein
LDYWGESAVMVATSHLLEMILLVFVGMLSKLRSENKEN